tara:strand:- start:1711 stop:2985 length:1275 start_codon:yes stop_codon:yes gene_type:complete
MAQYTDVSQLNGLFKAVYGDSVINLIPEASHLVKRIKFVGSDKETGDTYNQPVVLSNEHGITYAAAGSSAFTLNNSVALTMKNASLQGSQMVLRSSLSYDAAAKASNSKKAFVKGTELLVENMLESITKRLELQLLYGTSGGGLGNCDSSANDDATNTTITLTTASWASGIWAGSENAELDLYDGSSKKNTNAALVVVAVNLDNKTVKVSGNATDIAAIDTFIAADSDDSAYLIWRGAYSNEMAGIDKVITNSGSLFGISAADYGLWKGNSYSASSADLTMAKLLSGISRAVERGLNEAVVAYMNPVTWSKLNSDMAALRRLDSSYNQREGKQGSESIKYYGQNGEVEIVSHNMVKQGEAFVIPVKKCRRIGSQDISFKRPGSSDQMFRELSDKAGYELRVYTDQAFFCEAPARCVKITGIVNS